MLGEMKCQGYKQYGGQNESVMNNNIVTVVSNLKIEVELKKTII